MFLRLFVHLCIKEYKITAGRDGTLTKFCTMRWNGANSLGE